MPITVERVVPRPVAERFLPVYRQAFDHLRDTAAARQWLTDEEFLEEMADPDVWKFVGWSGGEPVALLFTTNRLDKVPWINPGFYRARYPVEAATGRIWYFGGIVVADERRGGPWAALLMRRMTHTILSDGGIVLYDCCAVNVERGVPALIDLVGRRLGVTVTHEEVDRQHYYAMVTSPAGDTAAGTVIDLRERSSSATVGVER